MERFEYSDREDSVRSHSGGPCENASLASDKGGSKEDINSEVQSNQAESLFQMRIAFIFLPDILDLCPCFLYPSAPPKLQQLSRNIRLSRESHGTPKISAPLPRET